MKHYEVQSTLIFGAAVHYKGAVLPEWYANKDGGLAARLERGALAETTKPVSVHLEPPAPKTEADPVPSIVAENNRLNVELKTALDDNKQLQGVIAELKQQLKGYEAQLASATQTIGALTVKVAEAERERDELLAADSVGVTA